MPYRYPPAAAARDWFPRAAAVRLERAFSQHVMDCKGTEISVKPEISVPFFEVTEDDRTEK
jgi:hypothetical protein